MRTRPFERMPLRILAVSAAVLALAWAADTPARAQTACETAVIQHASTADARLTDEEIQRVVDYVMGLARTSEPGKLEITLETIFEGTGVRITEENQAQVVPVVLATLQTSPEGQALIAQWSHSCSNSGGASSSCSAERKNCTSSCAAGSRFANRCAEYGACSLYGDLAGATGETLEMYIREKATDGHNYQDFMLPVFEATNLSGQQVTSTSLVGKPTVLVFLAGHCSHSFDTLPVLRELEEEYAPRGIEVVGVYVNSGSAEDIGSWIHNYKPTYDVWVHQQASIGDIIDSHLVPTYLMIDSNGKVREKLVGFKTRTEVEASLAQLVASAPRRKDASSGE